MVEVKEFFDKVTCTLTYIVYDPETKDAVIIDPVLDYDIVNSETSTEAVDELIAYVETNSLKPHLLMETHAHADHMSGACWLKNKFPEAKIVIGDKITAIQEVFKKIFTLPESFPTDGSQFDVLMKDGDKISAGSIDIEAMYTPGHTPACTCYKIGDKLFTGDAIFVPDFGTGRCDFPGGNAEDLYDSITGKIYSLDDSTEIFVGHDYPDNRTLKFKTSVGEQKKTNKHVKEGTSKEQFVEFRSKRDKELNLPKLIFQSIQVNITAGKLPPAENGVNYLKIPVNVFK